MAGESVEIQTVKQPTAVATPEEEKIKPTASFKLKQALQDTVNYKQSSKEETDVPEQNQALGSDTYTIEDIEKALSAYIGTNESDTMTQVALQAHKPEMKEDEVIISIDNALQLEKLESIKLNLHNSLLKRLNNGKITLSFAFFDNSTGKEKKKFFTSSEKLEHFMTVNPAVAELKSLFGLELE